MNYLPTLLQGRVLTAALNAPTGFSSHADSGAVFSWPPGRRKEAAWWSRRSGPRWETLPENVQRKSRSVTDGIRNEPERRRLLTFETVMWRSTRRQVVAVPRGGERAERLTEEMEAAAGGSELENRRLSHGGYLKVIARP